MRRRYLLNAARKRARRQAAKRNRITHQSQTVTVRLPSIVRMLAEDQRLALMNVIQRANGALKSGKFLRLDFKDITELHPCGTLVFMANFDRWIDLFPGKVTGTYPRHEVSEQLLQHFNVISKLGLPERLQITHDNVRFWHYKSGATVDSASYKDLAMTVRDNIAHPERELFADCLNEAVANSVGHAYDFEVPGLPPYSHRKWWVVSSLRDNHVFVAIYDMGVTIPSSLKRKPEWVDFLKLRRYKDARLISAAVSSSRTSTRLPHRGKGLPEMLEFSSNLASGFLSIASGKGAYRYDAQTGRETRTRLNCPIPGTLVLWQIPFRENKDERNHDIDS